MDSAFEARLRAREGREQEQEGLTAVQEAEARAAEGSADNGPGKPIVFVDGIRVSDSNDALELLDPDDIERIEVLKGGAAEVSYGNAAQNGVIQIFLKKSDRDGAVEPELAGTLRRRELEVEAQQQVRRKTNILSQRLLEARGEIVLLQQNLDRARESASRSTADLEQALARVETELREARTSMSEVERDRRRRSLMEIKAQIEAVRQRAARQIRR